MAVDPERKSYWWWVGVGTRLMLALGLLMIALILMILFFFVMAWGVWASVVDNTVDHAFLGLGAALVCACVAWVCAWAAGKIAESGL